MEAPLTAPDSPSGSPVRLSDCLEELLKLVLLSSVNGTLGMDIGLSNDFCLHLLKEDTSAVDYFAAPYTSAGVPLYPLYKHLASVMNHIIADGIVHTTSEEVSQNCFHDRDGAEEKIWHKLILAKGSLLTHMLKNISFELHVQEPYLTQLKDGLKTVEGRCAVGDYNRIGSGAILLFNKCLMLEVQDVCHYASFLEMLEEELLDNILPGVGTVEQGLQIYRNFYSEEKERLNGVLAICLSRPVSQPYTALAEIISGLGYEGVQCLLGLKHTTGTILDAVPPPRSALLSSFTALNKPNVVP